MFCFNRRVYSRKHESHTYSIARKFGRLGHIATDSISIAQCVFAISSTVKFEIFATSCSDASGDYLEYFKYLNISSLIIHYAVE